MKNKLYVINFILILLLLTGCTKDNKVLTCTSKTKTYQDITLSSEYIINYKNNYVTTLKTKEIITAKNKEDLNTYKETLENIYKEYNNIKYYTNTITIENNNLISSTIINYDKIDTDELIKIDTNNKSLIKNKKILVKDIKKMYQENGCICKEL